jgi:molybdopterin synthase sulfur carrier subunit
MIELVYFAWVRERIGAASEPYDGSAATVRDLVNELRAREPRYDLVFSDLTSLRVAIDQELVDFDAPLTNAKEVAFFPPMTGG